MTACELSTVVQENLKLNIAVINNGYLGMVRQQQEFFHQGRYVASLIGGPDFVTLAKAHGIEGVRVEARADLPRALEVARSSPKTVVLDIRVEALDLVYPMVPSGARLDEMIRRPEPVVLDAPSALHPQSTTTADIEG